MRINRKWNCTTVKRLSFPTNCIFCAIEREKRKGKEETIKVYNTGCQTDHQKCARTKQDHLLLARIDCILDNTSLIEVHYHKSCYRHYTRLDALNNESKRK